MIEAYRLADVPLVVPITLINHYVRKFDQPLPVRPVLSPPSPSRPAPA